MSDALALDGKRMRVVDRAEGAVLDRETEFVFAESDGVFTAEYRGGAIRVGFLVGRRDGDLGTFRYAQLSASGALDGGVSRCELTLTNDGRLRFAEHFEWESRPGRGTNIFEELREGGA